MSTSLKDIARDAGIDIPRLDGYQPPTEEKPVHAPAVHAHGRYGAGDEVDVFEMSARDLHVVAADRTASGRPSAEAKRANAELSRRAANRPVKKARQKLIAAAVADLDL
jgi:hypothetical protein